MGFVTVCSTIMRTTSIFGKARLSINTLNLGDYECHSLTHGTCQYHEGKGASVIEEGEDGELGGSGVHGWLSQTCFPDAVLTASRFQPAIGGNAETTSSDSSAAGGVGTKCGARCGPVSHPVRARPSDESVMLLSIF